MLPGFYHPNTRTHVKLLGPCFKTGHMKSFEWQQSWHSLCTLPFNSFPQFIRTVCSPPLLKINWERRGQPERTCAVTPLLDLNLHTTSYNTSRNQLPSCGAYDSVPTAVDVHCWEMRQFCNHKTGPDGPFRSVKCM